MNILVEFSTGESIEEAVNNAYMLAAKTGAAVRGSFNGVDMIIDIHSVPKELIANYYCVLRAEECAFACAFENAIKKRSI